MASEANRDTLRTLEQAFEVVRTLREMDGARVAEVAEELDMAPSTAYRYLTTLAQEGYVANHDGVYVVGLKFLDVGFYARNRLTEYRLAVQRVRDIAEETGERAQFVTEESGRGVYLHTEVPNPNATKTDRRTGSFRYLHSSASGKAILAHLPDRRVDRIVERHGLPAETERTITDRDELAAELDRVRSDGFALNDEESVQGLRAVGVPVHSPNGLVAGALSVSGPSHRLKGSVYREKIPNLLLGYANEIELKIRYA